VATTRRERRAAIRHLGRREITRRARRIVVRVLELAAQGFGPSAIASTTGLSERTVRAVLEDPEDRHRGEGRS
jgi:DNA-binding NarL/FixJ family response regulator